MGKPLEYNWQYLSKFLFSEPKLQFEGLNPLKMHICTTIDCSRLFTSVLIVSEKLESLKSSSQMYFISKSENKMHFCSHKKINYGNIKKWPDQYTPNINNFICFSRG